MWVQIAMMAIAMLQGMQQAKQQKKQQRMMMAQQQKQYDEQKRLAEEARQERMKKEVARRRVIFGARGGDSTGGSADAVIQGAQSQSDRVQYRLEREAQLKQETQNLKDQQTLQSNLLAESQEDQTKAMGTMQKSMNNLNLLQES